MAESLQWVFELFDKVSGPAERMAASVERLEKRLSDLEKVSTKAAGDTRSGLKAAAKAAEDAEKRMAELDRAAKRAANDSFKSLVNVLHDLMHIGQMAFGVLGGLFDRAIGGVQFALGAARFREDTRIALETMLRSSAEARDVMDRATEFAAKSPLSTEQVMSHVKMLIMGGFGKNDALALEEAVSDLGALKGFDKGAMDSFVGYLVKIKAKGHLEQDALSDMTRSGLMPEGPIKEEIAKLTGKSLADVDKAIASKAIDSVTAIQAFYNALGKIGGGEVGNLTKKGSDALSGLLSTLASRPQEMFMNLDKTAGIDSFKGFIKNLGDLLDPSSAFGQRVKTKIVDTFNRAFGAVFDGFSGPDGLSRMEEIFDMGLEGIGAFIEGFSDGAGPAFENFMKALKGDKAAMEQFTKDMRDLGEGASKAFGALIELGKVIGNTFHEAAEVIRLFNGEALKSLGTEKGANKAGRFLFGDKIWDQGGLAPQMNLMGGLQVPFTEFLFGGPNSMERRFGRSIANLFGGDELHDAGAAGGEALATGVQEGYTKKQEMHSPSKVFERYGKNMAEGLELGMAGNETGIQLASLNAKQVISQGGATEGGGPVNVSFNINASDAAKADKVRELVLSALTGAFEQVAIETGVA